MALCDAPPPETAAAALGALEPRAAERIGYVEEIRHPALLSPQVARGTMRIDEDGRMVRQQLQPEAETAIIGAESITLIGTGGGAVEILPIPPDLQPFLAAVRSIARGTPEALASGESLGLAVDPGGWRVTLGTAGAPALFGCGPRFFGIEIATPDGGARIIRFHEAP